MLATIRTTGRRAALASTACVALLAGLSEGQVPPARGAPVPAPAAAETPRDEVEARRRALQDELAAARRALAEATADGGIASDALVRSAETLERSARSASATWSRSATSSAWSPGSGRGAR